ncbi:unnamed protein product [Periconia digitata]|uniref:Uncharacterized protein n=1 Tax=Periconia digitata TaxID=1303443 RepID=A0A9W4XJL7_9PLEO|nr:unnamed protein product [Periconia digitata]
MTGNSPLTCASPPRDRAKKPLVSIARKKQLTKKCGVHLDTPNNRPVVRGVHLSAFPCLRALEPRAINKSVLVICRANARPPSPSLGCTNYVGIRCLVSQVRPALGTCVWEMRTMMSIHRRNTIGTRNPIGVGISRYSMKIWNGLPI